MSYLYVIAPVSGIGPSKIGISNDPDRRVRQLQTGFPERLAVHHRVEVPSERVRLYERIIARDLSHCRAHGEWFKLTAEQATLHVQWTLIHYEPVTDLERKFRLRRV